MFDDNRPMDFAKDKNSAKIWAKKRKQVWLNNLSKAESTSIDNYIKNSSEINFYSIKKKFALDNYEGIETLNEDLKNISTAVKKSLLTKPLYVYYYETNDKFGFNQNLESNLDSNIIDEEAINNFAKKISDTNFIQDGFKDVTITEPDISSKFPILVHLKLPTNTPAASYGNDEENLRVLIDQGYSLKATGLSIVTIKGKQYANVDADLIKQLNFENDVISASQWGEENYAPWLKELTPNELRDINNYLAGGYTAINKYLLNGTLGDNTSKEDLEEKISNISNALKKKKIPEDMITYRRMGPNEFGLDLNSPDYDFNKVENISKFKEKWLGKTIPVKTFISTTVLSNNISAFAKRKLILRLHLPKESNAAYVSVAEGYKNEYEVLIDHGYSYKIDNITEYYDESSLGGKTNKLIIDATLI